MRNNCLRFTAVLPRGFPPPGSTTRSVGEEKSHTGRHLPPFSVFENGEAPGSCGGKAGMGVLAAADHESRRFTRSRDLTPSGLHRFGALSRAATSPKLQNRSLGEERAAGLADSFLRFLLVKTGEGRDGSRSRGEYASSRFTRGRGTPSGLHRFGALSRAATSPIYCS